MKLLELLKAMFGQKYLNNIIGTKTNISKPIKLDKNSPFKLYSDSAFENPDVVKFIEKKLAEYGPYALSNKNMTEVKNFEMNARRYLNAKQGKTEKLEINPELLKMTDDKLNALAEEGNALQSKKDLTYKETKRLEYINNLLGDAQKLPETGKGLTEDLKAAGFKPEAEIVDITTQKPVDEKGIMTLKSELGLPKGVEPGSLADRAIKDSAQYKMDQQGVKTLLDKDYKPPKTTTLEDDLKKIENEMDDVIGDMMAKGYSAGVEAKRRAVIRQILLKDDRINLPEDVRNSLKNYDDLKSGGDQNMDPLKIFERYYERDTNKLESLDAVIDVAKNEKEAAEAFLKDEAFDVKPVRESLDDEAVEISETSELPDPEDLAEGGRPGFRSGTIMSPQMADFLENYADQMTFEQYLQMTVKRKNKAGGGLNYLMGM